MSGAVGVGTNGFNGGTGFAGEKTYGGGGGGGAGATGGNGGVNMAGIGGSGTNTTILGTNAWFGGGGGGGAYGGSGGLAGTGGLGGGGAGNTSANGYSGTPSTGGGGGGAGRGLGSGGSGGSGRVIISYPMQSLTVSSESTIKSQGSYSLKLNTTSVSSNGSLVRVFSPAKNLTGQTNICLDVYSSLILTSSASRLSVEIVNGNNNTTNIFYPSVTGVTAWTRNNFDISSLIDLNKNSISNITFRILNAQSNNTIYLDNVFVTNSFSFDPTTNKYRAVVVSDGNPVGYVPLFEVSTLGSTQTITAGVETKKTWSNEIYDTGNCFDPTNSWFITPWNGYYQFHLQMAPVANATSIWMEAAMRTNQISSPVLAKTGAYVINAASVYSFGAVSLDVPWMYLPKGCIVESYINVSVTRDVSGLGYTYWKGAYVSP